MSIKDLFNDYKSNQFSPAQSELSASKLVESREFIQNKFIEKFRYEPPIDFTTASNFAKYGSAELYYEYAFKRIYQQYPYDGSLAEQQEFHNNSTFLDKYIFEHVYPRTTGHITFSSEGWGTQVDIQNDYGLSNNLQYISVLGGPHTASGGMIGKDLSVTFDKSMIYDESKNRAGAFEWNPASGSTIEFWMKKSKFLNLSETLREVILDIWNGEATSSADYGRIRLELHKSNTSPINITMVSGTANVIEDLDITPPSFTSGSVIDDQWHHYAISIDSIDGTGTTINFYRDGTYLHTTSSTTYIGPIKNVAGGVNAYIGALQTAASGTATGTGWGKLSASLDEFRYWKKKRTSNEIGEYWFINMGGGTNEREYNTDLGVYFKFNEGITGNSTTDKNILDYSGRISNGIMVGYTGSARSTESALESITNVEEFKDPIIYSFHPSVSSSLATYKATGSIQDLENTSLFYNLFPSWIIEEDYENGQNLRYLTQIMASYFDTLNAQISGITEFKNKRYFSGSAKPNTYAREVLRGQGFVIPDIFIEADILEEIRGKDDNETYDGDIQKIKNLIYQNIYNNLNYIYKSKGTEKSFRNLFRCFGVDSELLKLNLYSDDSTYLYKDNYEFTSIAKPVLNLNKESQIDGTVYLSSSNGHTYLSSSEGDDERYTSMTFECEAIFPYKFQPFETGYFPTPFVSSSIAGFHRAVTDATDFTWHSTDTDLRMYAVKESSESRHAKFLLTGSSDGSNIEIESQVFKDVFDNNKWILAARVKHSKHPFAGFEVTGATGGNYIVEFYGVNSVANDVKNEFLLTQSVSETVGKNLLSRRKRLYAGSHRQNFTGSSLQNSEVKVSQVRFWQSHLSDEEIREHSYDPTNYGLIHPYRSDAIFQVSGSEQVYVPQIETLALHWDFMNVTSSDSSGKFIVNDISSGSTEFANEYSMIGKITKNKYDGYAEGFDTGSVNVVDKEFIYTAKKRLPDEVYSSDGVKIKSEDTENFFEDDSVADHFYMFEKSPYNAVSQQMINFFGSIKDFNSLIGDPAERYRFQYKQMEDLNRLFFERVENIPDPERFFEYFKWIDTSISYAISQLIPASSRFSEDIKDIVESHILERNKYQEKFPLVAEQRSTEGVIKSFSEISYNWKFGHAPLNGSNNKNCLWQKIRRKISNSNVQALRDNIYKTSNAKLNKLFDFSSGQVYEGGTDATRRLSKPYKLDMNLEQNIHGGTNYYVGKNRDFVLEVVHPHGPTSATDIPKNVLVVGVGEGQGLIPETICEDEEHPLNKEKYKFNGIDGRFSTDQLNAPISEFAGYKNFVKGIRTFPMNIMSQSTAVNTGYQSEVSASFSSTAYITNLHSDTVDRTNTVPMQGPFTERHIGGHQSRHIDINKYDTTLRDDDSGAAPPNNIHNIYTRAEAWRLLLGENPNDAVVDGAIGFTPPDYGISGSTGSYPDLTKKRASFYREEKAKRPVNIKNIKHRGSGSVVGNYKNNYEFLMLQGRRENNLYFRDNSELTNYLPTQYTSSLPHTTHVMSLVGIDPTDEGNVFGIHANNMQPDKQVISPEIPGTSANGSFSVSGSTVNGRAASGSFSFTRNTIAPTSASIQFIAKGRTIEQVESSGSFVVTGSHVAGAASSGSFVVKRPPFHTGHQGSFRVVSKDFLVETQKVTITQDPSGLGLVDSFGYDVDGNGSVAGVTNVVATASTITDSYTNLRNSIISNTNYTATIFSETSPTFGTGIWNNDVRTDTFLSGTFSTLHWDKQESWSAAFWLYLSSSNSGDGHIYAEHAESGFSSDYVRQILVDSSNNLIYRKHFERSGGTMYVDYSLDLTGYMDRWSHITLVQPTVSATSSAAAAPLSIDIFINGSEDLPPTISFSHDVGLITDIPTGSLEYTFYAPNNSVSKALLSGLDEFALWEAILTSTDANLLYNGNLYAARTTVSSSNLKAWWRFGDNFAADGNFDINRNSSLENNELLKEYVSNQHATASENSTELYLLDSIYETSGHADFTVATNNTGSGLTGTIVGSGTNYSNTSNIVTITNTGTALTVQDGDTITLSGSVFELDNNSAATGGNIAVAFTTNQNKTDFWNVLSASIKTNTDFDTISITDNGNTATFSLTTSVNDPARNGDITTETGTSFSSLVTTAGGVASYGATDGHTITISGSTFELDVLGNGVGIGNQDINCGVGVSNTDFWNSLSASIKANTNFDTIAIVDNGGTATFSLTASTGGTNNDGVISKSGASFPSFVQTAGGVNQSGSVDGKSILLKASAATEDHKKFIVETSDGSKTDDSPTGSFYVDSSVATDAEYWNNLSQSIKDRGFGVSYSASTGQATFTVTSYKTGSSGNTPSISSVIDGTNSFVQVSVPLEFSTGTDTGDDNDGNTFSLDGTVFELDSNSTFTGGSTNIASSGSLTNTQIFNNITASIKAQTDFDTVTYSTVGSTATFAITSSVTGTVKNGKFTAGTGFTMQSQTAGGTNESGSTDGDTILIDGITFELDNNSSVTGGNTAVDCSDGISNTNFWNSLTASIITNTVYDTVTYTVDGDIATFALTSSTTGSALNVGITETGNSFSVISGMASGSDLVPAVFSEADVVLAVPTPTLRNGDQNKTIISSHFSAPGGIEIESNAYLDVYARELSVHNALPFRNLTVRTDSGESGRIRVNDHLNKRRGLNTLLSNHAGKFGLDSEFGERKVVKFDGLASFINIGTATTWDKIIGNNTSGGSTQKLTFAAWINLDGTGGGDKGRIFDFGLTDIAFFVDSSLGLRFVSKRTGNNELEWQASGVLSLNSWNHVAVTYDANNMTNDPIIYVNGISKSLSLISGSKSDSYYGIVSQDCFIGNRDEYTSNYHNRAFHGNMFDAAIWNRVLSASDISSIYSTGPVSGLESIITNVQESLQLWYKLGEGFDTRSKFVDESGNGKHSIGINEIDFSNYIDESQPSFHKTHRNTSYRLHGDSSTSAPSLEKTENNAFFSTPIPASDFQYSWIDATLRTEHGIDSGQQNHYRYSPENGVLSSSAGIVEAIIFPSSSNIT